MSRSRGPQESRKGERDKSEAEGRARDANDAARRQRARPARPEREREKVMAAALKILAARPRSEKQLRERLLERAGADPEMVDYCIARLKEMGYVNDSLFAHSYASSRVSVRPVGRSRLARELASKRVSRETIDETLDDILGEDGEEALIERAIQKRIRTHGRPIDRGSAKRMFDHLSRLGFEYNLIIRKLRALRAEIEETTDDE
jgi:SOS response regulatory protein OraA/RecX